MHGSSTNERFSYCSNSWSIGSMAVVVLCDMCELRFSSEWVKLILLTSFHIVLYLTTSICRYRNYHLNHHHRHLHFLDLDFVDHEVVDLGLVELGLTAALLKYCAIM
ncbi:hypothetical protein Csa_014536 [Cucumis sativus]|nr:hypothetical protein Csa_014536 [Cucumis sativus]